MCNNKNITNHPKTMKKNRRNWNQIVTKKIFNKNSLTKIINEGGKERLRMKLIENIIEKMNWYGVVKSTNAWREVLEECVTRDIK